MLVPLLGQRIEVARFAPAAGAGPPPAMRSPVVFLHEALGSVSHWRDFPQRFADITRREAVVYSRRGHGRSSKRLDPFTPSYLHEEALIWLPSVLDALGLGEPFLFGHSDGASVALIAAGAGIRRLPGIIAIAPHVMVEDAAIEGIAHAKAAYRDTDFAERLARHHDDPDGVFRRWHEAWLSPAHRSWNIEQCLPTIACPVLAIQGDGDEYATMEHVDRVGRLAPAAEVLKLARCGHSPHRDRADTVLAAAAGFLARCSQARG